MKYAWKAGSRRKGSPQIVGESLERIRKDHGGALKPIHIVAFARPRSSPLHSHFDWNNRSAAEAYRIEQARRLIQCVVTREAGRGGRELKIRAFVSIADGQDYSFRRTADVMSDGDLRAEFLRRALEDVKFWKERYEQYREFAEICASVDRTERKLAAKAK